MFVPSKNHIRHPLLYEFYKGASASDETNIIKIASGKNMVNKITPSFRKTQPTISTSEFAGKSNLDNAWRETFKMI